MTLSLFFDFDASPETPSGEVYRLVGERALLGERLGFDTAWVAEHHFGHCGRLPSPLLFLARLSGITQSLRLGTAVVAAPLYDLQRLTEDARLVDDLSGGRLRLGLGFGEGSDERTWQAFGVNLQEREARTREAALQLEREFSGRLFVAGGGKNPGWIGEEGYGLLVPRVGRLDGHARRIEAYRQSLEGKAGQVALLRLFVVAETDGRAREISRALVARLARTELDASPPTDLLSPEYDALLDRLNVAIGSPESVRRKRETWQERLRPDELLCQIDAPELSHEDTLRSLNLLGSMRKGTRK